MVTAAGCSIERVDHLDRKWCLRCRHFPQVAFGLPVYAQHGAITLLCDVRDQVAEVGVGKYLAGQDAGDLVTCPAKNAFRALQRDQRLVGDEFRKSIVCDCSLDLPLAHLVEVGTIAGDVGEPLGPVSCEPAPPGPAGFGDTAKEEIQQPAAATPVRGRQPRDTQRLQPQGVILLRQVLQPVIGIAPRELDKRIRGVRSWGGS